MSPDQRDERDRALCWSLCAYVAGYIAGGMSAGVVYLLLACLND